MGTSEAQKWISVESWVQGLKDYQSREDIKYSDEKDRKYFGGNGNKAFERDGYECKMCGNKRHLLIHHRDGLSLYTRHLKDLLPNNNINNLVTLCYFCHQKVHGRDVTDFRIAIRRYFSFLKRTKIKTSQSGEGIILEYVSGSVIKVKMNSGEEKMFSVNSLLFLYKDLERFMRYIKTIYKNRCFNCKEEICSHYEERCSKCGWYICSKCGACNCKIREKKYVKL